MSFRHDQKKKITDIHHNLEKCGKLHSLVLHCTAVQASLMKKEVE